MVWQPIIEISKRGVFLDKLSEIADTLLKNMPQFKSNSGIVSDRIGVVLLLFYYAKFTGDDKYAEMAYELISLVFDELNEDIAGGSFERSANGLAGVGWTLEHLEQNGFLEIDTNELLGEVDELIHQLMVVDMRKKNYDYLDGALNRGLYFLNRFKNPVSPTYLLELANLLAEESDHDRPGELKFLANVPDPSGKDQFVCNIGMSHGSASIVWFLSKVVELGLSEKVPAILNGFMNYIWRQEQDIAQRLSYFPFLVVDNGPPSDSRLGWCYGDLGIGVALWQGSRSLGHKEWQEKTKQILLHCATRRELKKNSVVDAGMCHGTAGNAHMFNRMYHYTGLVDSKEAACYWLDETIKMAHFDDGYAGFKCWKGEDAGGWKNAADIFDGVAGIGLSLLAAVSDIEPAWDRVLLLS